MSLKPSVSNADHTQGNPNASLVIVEYGDYQCPYCGAAYPVLKELMKEFGDQIRFVFRNFPLSEMHQYARTAALAAEAAASQGKFWEMHDAIYENQEFLNDGLPLKLAEKLSLNIPRFKVDIHKQELAEKVDTDFESGIISGVNGTPSFSLTEINSTAVPKTFSSWYVKILPINQKICKQNQFITLKINNMSTLTLKDGTEIFYKDQGEGPVLMFHHGWPLSSDDWDAQVIFFYRRATE
jgi:thiol-disulfide isomerase/thioredoxin